MFRLACAGAILFLPLLLCAAEITANFDPDHTTIGFAVTDTLHAVHGTFRLKKGNVSFNPETGAISGEIVVDAASGSSGSAARDHRMTRDVLQAPRYPEIRFTPAKFTGVLEGPNGSDVQVSGSLWIHGEAHEITIPMRVQLSGDELKATGKLVVPYAEWGMKNPSNFLIKVNGNVDIDINAVARVIHSPGPRP